MARSFGLSCALLLAFVVALTGAAGAQWITNGAPVSTEMYDQSNPIAVSDGAGGAIVVWEDGRSGANIDIYAQRIDSYGNALWALGGVPLCVNEYDQNGCRIVQDGLGGAIVVWLDFRTGQSDIYAQRIDADGNALWAADGVPVCTQGANQWELGAVSDGAAGVIVVWSDWRSGSGDVFLQHIDSLGKRLWETDGLPAVSFMNDQYAPQIGPDGSGGVVVGWIDYRSGYSEVYAQRIGSDGTVLWTADGVPVNAGGAYQYDMSLASGSSGAVFTWTEYRTYYQDVFLQRLDLNGNQLWAAEGVAACPYESDKSGTRLVEDLSGGAILAWFDGRGENYPVYAQRVDADGTLLWAESGVMVYDVYTQSEIHFAPDGAGGAIVAFDPYYDYSETADIYAQRLDGSGNLLWAPPRGAALCTAPLDQHIPIPIPDGAGGAIIAWEDGRSGSDWNIYAQRIGSSGLWGTPEPEIISCLDVPADQGGWVRIKTRASSHDVVGEYDTPIAGYNVWRLIDDGGEPVTALSSAAAATEEERNELLALLTDPASAVGVCVDAASISVLGLPEGMWESVGFWFATRDTVYNIAVPTKNDSTETGIPWEVYLVTAHTSTAGLFVASQPDTGYSVDNLAPGVTEGLAGDEIASPTALLLTWTPNPASDLWKYDVYRGEDALFVPDASNLIGSTESTEFVDETWAKASQYFYKLLAVDRHGNASPAALLRPEDVNVGVLLQSYAAVLSGSCVEIRWALAELSGEMSFAVLRSAGASAPYGELSSIEIERGLA